MSDEKKTAFETVSDARAERFFTDSPEEALSGSRLASAEADPGADRSLAIVNLAVDEPERFLELVSYLPHALQDIVYQHFLLGRTQTQIGNLLGLGQTAVWQLLKLSVEGLCAVIAWGGEPPNDLVGSWVAGSREARMREAWEAVLRFRTKRDQRRDLYVNAPKALGRFDIRVTDDFEIQFTPQTTDGPVPIEENR